MLISPRCSQNLFVTGRGFALLTSAWIVVACATDSTAPAPSRGADVRPHAVSAAASKIGEGAHDCMPDAKLIGRIAASAEDADGTWWRMTKERFIALGVTDYKAALEGFYGQSFNTLDDAIAFLIDGVKSWDANGNGYVCAFEVRGTRAYLGVNALFLFGIADDKHSSD